MIKFSKDFQMWILGWIMVFIPLELLLWYVLNHATEDGRPLDPAFIRMLMWGLLIMGVFFDTVVHVLFGLLNCLDNAIKKRTGENEPYFTRQCEKVTVKAFRDSVLIQHGKKRMIFDFDSLEDVTSAIALARINYEITGRVTHE